MDLKSLATKKGICVCTQFYFHVQSCSSLLSFYSKEVSKCYKLRFFFPTKLVGLELPDDHVQYFPVQDLIRGGGPIVRVGEEFNNVGKLDSSERDREIKAVALSCR